MNIRKIQKYLIAVLVAMTISFSANAFISLPPCPICPTVDGPSDVLMTINTIQTKVQEATAQVSSKIQEINQKAKAMISKYVGKFKGFMQGIFKKKQKQALPGAKEIKESKIADIYDTASVQAAMYTLFFQYPADCEDTLNNENVVSCDKYKNLAKEFYQDTIVEIYTSSRELEKQFDALETSIADVEKAVAEGSKGMESPEDENGVWKNAYNVYETMNTILKIIQEIQAMRAQYIAVQAIGNKIVYPALPEKDSADENAMNIFAEETVKITDNSVKNISTLGFAQKIQEKKQLKYKKTVGFSKAPGNQQSNPFASNSDNLKLLNEINAADDNLSKALVIHNKVRSLEGIRQLYIDYKKTQKSYQKALESLKKAEKCTIDYFAGMYENPRQMWNGGLSDEYLTNHDMRKGISGWAVKAYNLAKAEDAGVVIDSENDLAESPIDTTNIDPSDLSQMDSIQSNIDKDMLGSGFKDEAQTAKLDESIKESDRIAWNIGSEAARILAEDQFKYGKNGNYGKAHTLYPVWNDTKSYYNQYIDGKYDNIISQLELINTNDIAIKIASAINDTIDSEKERDNNANGLSRLERKIASEKGSAITNVEQIIANKQQTIRNLNSEKEKQTANLNAKKRQIEQKINKIQEQLDKLNIQRQEATEKLQKAEVQVSTMEDLVDIIVERQYGVPKIHDTIIKNETFEKEIIIPVFEEHSYNFKGTYFHKDLIANAQLATISFEDNVLDSKKEYKTEIRTYIRDVWEDVVVEEETPSSLLLAEHSLEEGRQAVLDAQQKIASLNSQIEKLKAEQEVQRNIIKNEIEPKLAAYQEQYVVKVNEAIKSFDEKLSSAATEYRKAIRKYNSIDLASYYKNNFSIPIFNGDGSKHLFSLLGILQRANEIVSIVEGAAQEMVRETVKKMYAMGDRLYNPEYHSQVVNYHRELMNNLKEIPAKTITSFGKNGYFSYPGYSGVLKLAQTMYQSYMLNEVCTNDSCKNVDSKYFVSNDGKSRDFLAPKSVPQEVLPTVREMVLFDHNDYNNVPTSKNGNIVAIDFLNNLTYIPEIWRLILTSPAYVEKDIDLSAVIIPSEDMFVNGGIYPCVYGNYLITSAGDKYNVYYHKGNVSVAEQLMEDNCRKEVMASDYMECRGIEVTRKSENYFTVKNIAENESGTAQGKGFCTFKDAKKESELGYLLKYDNGLRYNEKAFEALKTLSDAKKNGDESVSQKLVLYSTAILNRNQIGEFLKVLDNEQELKQNLDEFKVEINEAEQDLFNMFAEIGFTPASGFSLDKADDYALARNTLLRYRNKLLSSAISKVSALNNNENVVIKDRMIKINNIIGALKKDSDAYTNLSDSSEDGAELDEAIKTEKANRSIVERQEGEADKDFENQMNKVGDIYCSQLKGNM